jgi:hypothetical protein
LFGMPGTHQGATHRQAHIGTEDTEWKLEFLTARMMCSLFPRHPSKLA